MFTYRNASNSRRWIRRLGIVVESQETFKSDRPIDDANFELVVEKKPGDAPAKEARP